MQASAQTPMWELACVFDEVERARRARTKRPKGRVIGVGVGEEMKGTVLVGLDKSWSK